jgi:hypothetical protein
MPRTNDVTKRVFADIAENHESKGAYDSFLELDKTMGLPESKSLIEMKEKYFDLVEDCKGDVQMLATLEEIIIQMRSKEVIDTELRLSLSRQYIYARSLFYRRGKAINDIRVIAGTTKDFGTDMDKLLEDPEFKLLCKNKLLEAMDKEIDKNVKTLNPVYVHEKI